MWNNFGQRIHCWHNCSLEQRKGSSRDHFQRAVSLSKIGNLHWELWIGPYWPPTSVIDESFNFFLQSSPDQDYVMSSNVIKDIECGIADCNYRFALTGQTWQAMRKYYPELVDRVCVRSAIFARMSSDQKQQLVVELMQLGYYVGTYFKNERTKKKKKTDKFVCVQ